MSQQDDLIDVSVPMRVRMPQWAGEEIYSFEPLSRTPGDVVNVSKVTFTTHTGTHVDSSWHFIHGGRKLDEIPLADWNGPVVVVDCRHLTADITADDLNQLNIPTDATKLIFRTTNSDIWRNQPEGFTPEYIALSPSGATWVVEHGIKLVGIDYLSIGAADDSGVDTHLILLGSQILIVEGLDLEGVDAGNYDLLCFPLHIAGADGAPARVALRGPKSS